MTVFTSHDFRSCVQMLREKCPAVLPVEVQRVAPARLDGYAADTDTGKGRGRLAGKDVFIIRISNKLPPCSAIDALVHEWAHALGWAIDHDLHAHNRGWEAAMGRCYRAYERWTRDLVG